MKRRLFGMLLCLCLAVFLLPISVLAAPSGNWTDTGNYDTSWYEASQTSFTITDPADLAGLAVLVNGETDRFSGKTITLGAEIDLGAHLWTPIASDSKIFNGTFDGNGYVIKNMTINIDTAEDVYAGLFGKNNGGTIRNVGMENSSVTVTSTSLFIFCGGVVGYNHQGTVANCYNTGDFNATGIQTIAVGGVVGQNTSKCTITNCYNAGDVTASDGASVSIGGIAGYHSFDSTITNCYNTGKVSASDSVSNVAGGVAGNIYAGSKVTNCYNTGKITASGSNNNHAGGVVGFNEMAGTWGPGTVSNCYFLTDSAATGVSFGDGQTTPLSSAQMNAAAGTKDGENWAEITIGGESKGKIALVDALNLGVDTYNNTQTPPTTKAIFWEQWNDVNSGYPCFPESWTDPGNYDISWYDSEKWSFTISNEKELAGVAVLANGLNGETPVRFEYSITLGADLDLGGKLWTPIGTKDNSLSCIFNGGGHVIRNMRVNVSSTKDIYAGLLGYAQGSNIRNVRIENSTVTALGATAMERIYAGGVVGYIDNAEVSNCYNTGSVRAIHGQSNNAGGIVGYNAIGSTVVNCYNTGKVSAERGVNHQAGGIIGNSYRGTVTNCYNTASVSAEGSQNLGSLTGYSSGTEVTNCYYLKGTTGTTDVGIGYAESGTDTTTPLPAAQMKAAAGTTNGEGWAEITIGGASKGNIALVDALNLGTTVHNAGKGHGWALEWKQEKDKNGDYPVFSALATEVTLDKTTVTLAVGGTTKVTATVVPATAIQGVRWMSYDHDVIDVDDEGNITAIAPGSAEIHVRSLDENASAVCTVTVLDNKATLSFNTNGGSAITSVEVTKDTTVDLSKYTTTKKNYTFTGWYADKALTDKITTIKISEDAKVYAGWSWNNPFTDISKEDWFYNDVTEVYDLGLMIGTDADSFSPQGITTRGMLVTILWRLDGEPNITEPCPFKDVKAGSYYETAITWAAQNKIVQGYGNSFFAPEDAVTREQMATILYRYAVYKGCDVSAGTTTDLSAFGDTQKISDYALTAMKWACGIGMIQGDGKNLMPKEKATRAETAAMAVRFLNTLKK